MTADEVVTRVLPNLRIPRWQFTPDDPADWALGSHVWQEVSPSFRALRTVLEIASLVATEYHKARIDKQLLDIVLQWMHDIDRAETANNTSAPRSKAGAPPRTKQRQDAETTGQQLLQVDTGAKTNPGGAVAAEHGDSAEHRSVRSGDGATSPSTILEQKNGDRWDAQQAAITAEGLVNALGADKVAQNILAETIDAGEERERLVPVEGQTGTEQADATKHDLAGHRPHANGGSADKVTT